MEQKENPYKTFRAMKLNSQKNNKPSRVFDILRIQDFFSVEVGTLCFETTYALT